MWELVGWGLLTYGRTIRTPADEAGFTGVVWWPILTRGDKKGGDKKGT
jgi:hypothetical protein